MGTEKRRGHFILNKIQEQNTPFCSPLFPYSCLLELSGL